MLKKYDNALDDFTKSLDINPDNAETLSSRGEVYRTTGKYENALSDLNKSLSIEPTNAWALSCRGSVYY